MIWSCNNQTQNQPFGMTIIVVYSNIKCAFHDIKKSTISQFESSLLKKVY